MKGSTIALVIVLILVVGFAAFWFTQNSWNYAPGVALTPSSTGATGTGSTPSSTATSPLFDQTLSDGTITVRYPSADFALATSQAQILVHPYIPPCDSNFNYCLYYSGTAYQGTNFESAGLRIQKRTTLTTRTKCLTTQPTGYSDLTPMITSSTDYAASAFAPVGGGAAGHLASGALYRLFYNGACYEFETRIGQSEFANYPSGTIQQFTTDDQASANAELQNILHTVTLPSGESVSFPA